jgi:hypothetical protein
VPAQAPLLVAQPALEIGMGVGEVVEQVADGRRVTELGQVDLERRAPPGVGP